MARVVRFAAPRQVDVVDAPPRPLPAGAVRVRTRYSGISAGTELTAYRGTNPYLTRSWDPEQRLFTATTAEPGYPLVGWGYSEVGEVVEVAPDMPPGDGMPRVGDVVWGIWGHRGEGVLAAERVAYHQLPAGTDPLVGVFARVGAIALNAVLAAGIRLGETAAVFGQGVLGLLATRLATLNGAEVVAVDALAERLVRSRDFGAVTTVQAGVEAVGEKVRAVTRGRGADVAIEISGSYAALQEAIRSVGTAGRVVAAGFYQGEATALRLGEEFHHNRVQLVCSQIGGVAPELSARWDVERLQQTFMRLAVADAIDLPALVSHVVPVEQAASAYAMLDSQPADALQVVLEF
jgi:2-desacetyl-2-hydroxyethyl bacteriochlorophyllide A dehydrogenase